jgi:hypothetical protein
MTKVYIFLILIISGNFAFAEEVLDELNRKIWKGIKSPSDEDHDLSWLTEDIRPAVIERLLRFTKDSDSSIRRTGNRHLVTLGHPETIQRIVNELRTNPYKGDELSYLTEEGIPYIMPLVYHGSMLKPPLEGDVMVNSIRSSATAYLMRAIMYSKKLPLKTRDWVLTIGKGDEEKCYELLIQWWEKNQIAIIEKRYADATWLPMYKGKPATYSPEETAERKADLENKNRSREARRSGGKNTEPNATPTPDKNWSLWGIIICFAALLGISIRWKIAGRRNS